MLIVPQMISLRKDPKGETVFDKKSTLSTAETGEFTLKKSVDSDTVATLTERVKQLESELKTYKVINDCSVSIHRAGGTHALLSLSCPMTSYDVVRLSASLCH